MKIFETRYFGHWFDTKQSKCLPHFIPIPNKGS